MNTSQFERGTGCFVCNTCGKKTRNVDGNAQLGMCKNCFDLAGHENEHLDGHFENEDCGIKRCPFRFVGVRE